MIEMKGRVAIYVPQVEGRPYATREVARDLCRLCGGATVTAAQGFWDGGTGELEEDHIQIVYAYHDRDWDDLEPEVLEIAHRLKDDLGQKSVAIEEGGRLLLV